MANTPPVPWIGDRGKTLRQTAAADPVQHRRTLHQDRDRGVLRRRDFLGTDTLDAQRSHQPDKGSLTNPCPTEAPLLLPRRTRRDDHPVIITQGDRLPELIPVRQPHIIATGGYPVSLLSASSGYHHPHRHHQHQISGTSFTARLAWENDFAHHPVDELERAAVTIRQIKTGLGLEDSVDPPTAFAIPESIGSVSANHEGIDPRFAAHWREEMGSNDILEWHLRLDGSFAARAIRLKNRLYRLNVRKWYGEWCVYLNDPAGPWIELVATDLDSPAIGLLGALAGQSKTSRESLDRLTRSANITSHTQREFTLSWSGYSRKHRCTSIWKML